MYRRREGAKGRVQNTKLKANVCPTETHKVDTYSSMPYMPSPENLSNKKRQKTYALKIQTTHTTPILFLLCHQPLQYKFPIKCTIYCDTMCHVNCIHFVFHFNFLSKRQHITSITERESQRK